MFHIYKNLETIGLIILVASLILAPFIIGGFIENALGLSEVH